MKNEKIMQVSKVIGVVFVFSVTYSLVSGYPDNISSFDLGYAAGSAFGQAIKMLGFIGLMTFGIKAIRGYGRNTLARD